MTRRIQRWGCTVLVCIAACQSDEAPSASGAEPAAMTEPTQSAAGSPAATGSGGSSTVPNTGAMPAAASGGARPAMSGAANAPAAAGGPEQSATPSTAGAPAAASDAMAGTGSAGSSADSKPAKQPAENPSAAASCEPPNTYTRATRSALELSWPETLVFTAGTGTLVTWGKVTYTKRSDGALEMESRPCGSVSPAVTLTELAGGLKSAAQIPFTAFDSPNMPTLRTTIMPREDRSLSFRYNTPLGTMLSDPDAEWPSPSMLVPFDHDGDGSPGVTVVPLEGPEYAKAPTSISQLEFVDRLYVASRIGAQVSVTPACSGTAVGTIEPLGFDTTVVGCHVEDRDDCDETEVRFFRNGQPIYTLGKSGNWTEVEVPQDATCADVRAALPPP